MNHRMALVRSVVTKVGCCAFFLSLGSGCFIFDPDWCYKNPDIWPCNIDGTAGGESGESGPKTPAVAGAKFRNCTIAADPYAGFAKGASWSVCTRVDGGPWSASIGTLGAQPNPGTSDCDDEWHQDNEIKVDFVNTSGQWTVRLVQIELAGCENASTNDPACDCNSSIADDTQHCNVQDFTYTQDPLATWATEHVYDL